MTGSTYLVERTTTIVAEPQRVYDDIVDFHRWMQWSPWEGMDPNQKRTFEGPERGVGARYGWSGNRKVGQGSMEIVEASEPSEVRIALTFEAPFKSRSTTFFLITPEDEHVTRVTWQMIGEKTLGLKIMGIVASMDSMLGKDFEKGLANLQRAVEGKSG
jgi:uncharacterized protein YndB with AHSA1/START domain